MERGRSRGSHRIGGALVAAALAIGLHAGSARAVEFSDTLKATGNVAETAFDLVVLRPLSATALAIGSVFFVASAPFVLPEGWIRTGSPLEAVRPAWSTFVYAPYEYTVLRDLGDL